jgi:glycosyltransferase involved in cell wall biosynthesis
MLAGSVASDHMNGVLALSWFEHRRTRELCGGLGIELAMLVTPRRGLSRYLLLTARTLALLLRRRPAVLLVQNPSLILSVLALVLRSPLGYRLFVDAHNEAVEPYQNRQPWIGWLSRKVMRRADLTIVTNRQLAQIVRSCGGKPFVLPDRIPVSPGGAARRLGPGFNVAAIATFAKDEPVAEIFEAARDVPVQLHVTGDPARLAPSVAARAPPNARFTGFLAEEDYWSLLRSADAVIDLTVKPDCLVCGAYEALALGKPLLLSANAASIELFGNGALYTDNSPADIRRGLMRLAAEQESLRAAAALKRDELVELWKLDAQSLRAELTPAPPVPVALSQRAAPHSESSDHSA